MNQTAPAQRNEAEYQSFLQIQDAMRSLMAQGIAIPDDYKALYIKLLLFHGQLDELRAFGAPLGITVLKITAAEKWAESRGLPILALGEAEEILIMDPPHVSKDGYFPNDDTLRTITGNKPFVAEMHDVVVRAQSDFILTPDGFAIHNAASHPLYGSFVSLMEDKTVMGVRGTDIVTEVKKPDRVIEKGIFLSGLASKHFAHWFAEILPKLRLYEKHPAYKDYPIIVDDVMPDSHYDYLKRLTSNEVIRIPNGHSFFCHSLLVAPTPSFFPFNLTKGYTVPNDVIAPISPEALYWLRSKILATTTPHSPPLFSTKIYLSRRKMAWRHMKNEAEVAACLEARGFQPVYIEELSLDEQIELFRHAEIIVAPNGSGTVNLVYAPESVRLIMLSQSNLFNWCGYCGPLRAMGYKDILFVISDEYDERKHASYTAPIDLLEAALDRAF